MAEGEGFEPPVPFRAQRFSRPPVSTTHPSLRAGKCDVLDQFIVMGLCAGFPGRAISIRVGEATSREGAPTIEMRGSG